MVCAAGSNWLRKSELDRDTIRLAKLVVCDDVRACQQEAGDFSASLEHGEFRWEDAHELSAVVQQGTDWRKQNPGRVIFKSVGLALEDVALGAELLRQAKKQGMGRDLPW